MTTSVPTHEPAQPVRQFQRPERVVAIPALPQQRQPDTASGWREHVLLLRGCLHKLVKQLAPELTVVTASDYPKSMTDGQLDGGTFSGFLRKNWLWNAHNLWDLWDLDARPEHAVIRDFQFTSRVEGSMVDLTTYTDLGAESNIGFSRSGASSVVPLLRTRSRLSPDAHHTQLSVVGVRDLFRVLLPELAVWPLYRAGIELGLLALDPFEDGDIPWTVQHNLLFWNQVSPDMLARWFYTAYRGLRATGVTQSTVLLANHKTAVPSVCFHYSPRAWAISSPLQRVAEAQHNYLELACVARSPLTAGLSEIYGEEGMWQVEITVNEPLFGSPSQYTPWVEEGPVVPLRLEGLRWLSGLLTTVISAEFLLLCEEAGLIGPHSEKVSQ